MLGLNRPPVAVRAIIGADERVLAWAGVREVDQRFVVATNRGLWWPDESARLILWHLINKVVWSDGVLAVTEADLDDDLVLIDQPPVTVRLDDPEPVAPVRDRGDHVAVVGDPAKLTRMIRQRVEGSVAQTHLIRLGDGAARIVARKVSGTDGLAWWARLEPGTPDTVAVRDQIATLISGLRAEEAARRADL